MWELDYKERWELKNWCFWTVVLEKTPKSPLDSKEIQPVHLKGHQSWRFIGRTDAEVSIVWPPDVKRWLTGKDPDAGKDWRQKEKGVAENEMVGWRHWLNGYEFQETVTDFLFLDSKTVADGDYSHEIERLLGRKVMTNLDSVLKSRDITLLTKVHLVKAMLFQVMYGCESWPIMKAEH